MKCSRLVCFVSAAFLGITFSFTPQSLAADLVGNPWPGHKVSPVSCEPTPGTYEEGTVHAYPPSFVRSSGHKTERVVWSPSLYRSEGNEWVLVSDKMASAYAFATPNGIVGGWFNSKTHKPLTVSSEKTTVGTYRILNSLYGKASSCMTVISLQTLAQFCREPKSGHHFSKKSASSAP